MKYVPSTEVLAVLTSTGVPVAEAIDLMAKLAEVSRLTPEQKISLTLDYAWPTTVGYRVGKGWWVEVLS